ncbi:MAG: DUF928 domain-containing protein [Elainella sp.]
MVRRFLKFHRFHRSLKSSSKLSLPGLVMGLTWLALTLPSLAQYTPPDQGLPGRREGGGTRGGCLVQQPHLTALMPESNLGLTLAARPSFFWYVPQTAAVAEFVLLDANNTELYKTQVPLAKQAGIMQFTLPETAPALQVNQSYRWFFSLVCEPLDRSADVFVSGWVKRVEYDPGTSQALVAATPAGQTGLYAEAGLWYDALATLADLRRTQPQNPTLINQWQALLQSVGLTQIAELPLL